MTKSISLTGFGINFHPPPPHIPPKNFPKNPLRPFWLERIGPQQVPIEKWQKPIFHIFRISLQPFSGIPPRRRRKAFCRSLRQTATRCDPPSPQRLSPPPGYSGTRWRGKPAFRAEACSNSATALAVKVGAASLPALCLAALIRVDRFDHSTWHQFGFS